MRAPSRTNRAGGQAGRAPRRRTQRERSEESARRLLNAAIEVISEKGYEREGTYSAALRRYHDQVRREQERATGRTRRKAITRTPRRRETS